MLGLTRYCPSFLYNEACHRRDCALLHHLVEESMQFTLEEVEQGYNFPPSITLVEYLLSGNNTKISGQEL